TPENDPETYQRLYAFAHAVAEGFQDSKINDRALDQLDAISLAQSRNTNFSRLMGLQRYLDPKKARFWSSIKTIQAILPQLPQALEEERVWVASKNFSDLGVFGYVNPDQPDRIVLTPQIVEGRLDKRTFDLANWRSQRGELD